MATFTIKRGDTSPALRYPLSPATVDLSGASVSFSMAAEAGPPILYRAPAEVVTTTPPVVQYAWQAGDTDRAGMFDAEFVVTFADGRVETFPNSGFIPVTIAADAGWRPQPQGSTITYTLGDTDMQPLVLTDDHGQPLDLTDATVTVNLRIGAVYVPVPTTLHDPIIGEAWPDWSALDLSPRLYLFTVTITWPDDLSRTDERRFNLDVQEGR